MHLQGSRRRAAAAVLAASVLVVGGSISASAQIGGQQLPPVGSSTTTQPQGSSTTTSTSSSTTSTTASTTSTTAPPSSSTTTTPGLFPGPSQPGTTTSTTAPPPGEPGAPAGGGDGAPAEGAGPMPPELEAMTRSVRRTGANNTRKLLGALEPLGQYGLDPTQRALVGFGRFPVAGETVWSDDWWLPRFGPGWRLHEGIDLFATHGTPVRAPVDGTVRISNGGLGGLAVYVVQPNRTYWYLAHLAALGPGIVEGATVTTGQVVGFVGDSGNARGGAAHLHLEIHPNGGGPIPPKAVMDRFVADALGLVPQLLQLYADAAKAGQQAAPAPIAAPEPELVTLSPRAALLWASSVNPAGGTLRLVEADAAAAAERVDWDAVLRTARRRAERRQAAARWLAPLVPRPLAEAAGLTGPVSP